MEISKSVLDLIVLPGNGTETIGHLDWKRLNIVLYLKILFNLDVTLTLIYKIEPMGKFGIHIFELPLWISVKLVPSILDSNRT